MNLSQYEHRVYILPDEVQCLPQTHGILGSDSHSTSLLGFNWANDSRHLITHELMHNAVSVSSPDRHMIMHANYYECPGDVSIAASGCTSEDYNDFNDVMGGNYGVGGNQRLHHFGGPWKVDAGFLDVTTVTPGNNYDVYRYNANSGPKILRVKRGNMTGENSYIYITYRRDWSYDLSISTPNKNGVMLHLWNDGSRGSGSGWANPVLIDASPSTIPPSFLKSYDAALPVGQFLYDPVSNIKIKTVSTGTNKATIQVSTGQPAAQPTVVPLYEHSCVYGPEEGGCYQGVPSCLEEGYTLKTRNVQFENCSQPASQRFCGECVPNLVP